MRVLLDNCTAPAIASTLDGFIRHYGHSAVHIKDVDGLPRGRNSADIEWIDYLRRSNDTWIFVSGDTRIIRHPAERSALRSAGLHGFILSSAYQKTPLHQVAAILLWRWPEILRITELLEAPSMHEIPINKSSKLRPLPL